MFEELIKNRIKYFLGYGNLNSDYWFILMEEGISKDVSLKEIKTRFKKTTKDKQVLDCYEDMKGVREHMEYYGGKFCREKSPPLQPTIKDVIRVLLNIEKSDFQDVDKEDIREFQRFEFGRENSKYKHLSLQFMPLPIPKDENKKDIWIYDSVDLPYLKSKEEYNKEIMPKRIALFKDLIKEHTPQVVIFYSFTYCEEWEKITGEKYDKFYNEFGKKFWHVSIKKINFFILPSPTAPGFKNEDWDSFGQAIKKILSH